MAYSFKNKQITCCGQPNFTFQILYQNKKEYSHLQPINSKKWVNHESWYARRLGYDQNRITAMKGHARVFPKCFLGKRFFITIQLDEIAKISPSNFHFGIVSAEYMNKPIMNLDFLAYFRNGEIGNGKGIDKDFKLDNFTNSDQITIAGDFELKFVRFIITKPNFEKAIVIPLSEIEKESMWVPFIELSSGDTISIVESFFEIESLATFLAESYYKWDEDIYYEIDKLMQLETTFDMTFKKQKEQQEKEEEKQSKFN